MSAEEEKGLPEETERVRIEHRTAYNETQGLLCLKQCT